VTIFESLVTLNPYLRPTAYECLKNKVFDPFRDVRKEKILDSMQSKRQEDNAFPNLAGSKIDQGFQLDIDKEDAYDYHNPKNRKYSKHDVKSMIIREILDI